MYAVLAFRQYSISREARLSLGSGANYSEMSAYLLTGLLFCYTIIPKPSQFCLVAMCLM